MNLLLAFAIVGSEGKLVLIDELGAFGSIAVVVVMFFAEHDSDFTHFLAECMLCVQSKEAHQLVEYLLF